MSGFGYRNLGFGGGKFVEAEIPMKSLRFDSAGSHVLKRTPGSASNQDTYTWSAWIKRAGSLTAGGYQCFFGSGDTGTSSQTTIWIPGNANYWGIYWGGAGGPQHAAKELLRDPGGWYHLVCAVDTTDATANDMAKLYMNGRRVTAYQEQTEQSQNTDTYINQAAIHAIGGSGESTSAHFFSGYMAEVHFVDGAVLTPATFGETGDYGEWKPIVAPAGITYGTNGFYLNFALSTADATGIGLDVSGNGNNWTPTGIAATDQMLDSPTNNFATLNSLTPDADNPWTSHTAAKSLTQGNLRALKAGHVAYLGGFGMSSGKWYWEAFYDNTNMMHGIVAANHSTSTAYSYNDASAYGVYPWDDNRIEAGVWGGSDTFGGDPDDSGGGDSQDHLAMYAYDADANKLWIGIDGDWDRVQELTSDRDPSTGTNPDFTPAAAYKPYVSWFHSASTSQENNITYNFGQDSSFAGDQTGQNNTDGNGYGDFYYEPPSGFLACCTRNIATPAVIPSAYFNTVLYAGNGGSQSITGVGFQPDMMWHKSRSATQNHRLIDAIRGEALALKPDLTAVEVSTSVEFSADGWDFTGNTEAANDSGKTYVGWNWLAGNATLGTGDFTQGDIASTCSRNAAAGFSIVSYTGNGSAGATVGHGLSKAPEIMIVKNRSKAGGEGWTVFVNAGSMNETDQLSLNSTAAATDTADAWNDTAPTATLFSIAADDRTNDSGATFIAYCWHSVDGYSKVGSYIGNGNADGPFVYTGFRPAWIMVKRTDNTGNWWIYDAARNTYNVVNNYLFADTTAAEASNDDFDFLSNGFKLRLATYQPNTSGATFIFMAFAETPMKYSNAR